MAEAESIFIILLFTTGKLGISTYFLTLQIQLLRSYHAFFPLQNFLPNELKIVDIVEVSKTVAYLVCRIMSFVVL